MKLTGNTEKPADCNVCVLRKMTQGTSRVRRCQSTEPISSDGRNDGNSGMQLYSLTITQVLHLCIF